MNTRTNAAPRTNQFGKVKPSNRYVPNRFNDLKYNGNPITNHVVEQVLRAVCYPSQTSTDFNVYSTGTQMLTEQSPTSHVLVGTAYNGGWCFHSTTNSYLIRLGIKPDALLLRLQQQHIEGVQLLREQDGLLYYPFFALVQAAYDAVMRPVELLSAWNEYLSTHGYPEHFRVNGVYTAQPKPIIYL